MIEAIEPSTNNCSNAIAGTKQQAIDALNADREWMHQAINDRSNTLIEDVINNAKVRIDALSVQAAELRQFVSFAYQWIEANHDRLRSSDDFSLMKAFLESKEAIKVAVEVPRFLRPVYEDYFGITMLLGFRE